MTERSIVHSFQTCRSWTFLLQPAGCCILIIHTSVWGISQSPALQHINRAIKASFLNVKPFSSRCITAPWWSLSVLVKLFSPSFSTEMRTWLFSKKVFSQACFSLLKYALGVGSILMPLAPAHNYTRSRTLTFKSMQNCAAEARARTENARGCDECA